MPLWRAHLPEASLSLGWNCQTVGLEPGFTKKDVREMVRVCKEYAVPGGSVVFSPSIRLAKASVPQLTELLNRLDGSQLLFWTGTGELPVLQGARENIDAQFAQLGLADRIGYDIHVAQYSTELMAAVIALIGVALCSIVRWSLRIPTRK